MTPSSLPCPVPSSLQEVAGDPGGASPVGGPHSWIYIMYDIYIYIHRGIVLCVYIYNTMYMYYICNTMYNMNEDKQRLEDNAKEKNKEDKEG